MESLLLKNGLIVTMNSKNEVVENGNVFINGGKIESVGKETPVNADQVGRKLL
jgi:cytosine/adenosine deaminase-related metal-dependent hydrolase